MSNSNLRILVITTLVLLTQLLQGQEKTKLVILHTNDMHSRLDGFAPSLEYSPQSANDDKTIGGFSRIASIIEHESSTSPENTLVLDAGDFLMGTLFHSMEESTGFQLPLMSSMGYEVVAIGNHEFDYGPETLARIIEKSATIGKIPDLLLTNAKTDPGDPGDDRFEMLLENEKIRRYVFVEKAGRKIGIFSLMGVDADDVAPFAPPVTFSRQIRSAKRTVRKLKNEGADLIICLSHSGLEKDKKDRWAGEDVKLAKRVRGLDLIISGHTHISVGTSPGKGSSSCAGRELWKVCRQG